MLIDSGKSFTDAQVTQSVDALNRLGDYEPMSADLDDKLIKSICSKLKLGARMALDNAKTIMEGDTAWS